MAKSSQTSQLTEEQLRHKELSHKLVSTVGQPEWADLFSDDVVFEFPCATLIGYPEKIEGKKAAMEYVDNIVKMTGGLNMFDIVNSPSAEADFVFNEYKGYHTVAPKDIIPYIAVHQYKDGKVVMVREFWDPIRVSHKTGVC